MTEQWWWDLKQGRAVRDDERGPAKDVLGPYPTRSAAENWRQAHEGREEAWKHQDEEWDGDEPEPPAPAQG
jgi:hypothetical protein